MGRITQKSNYRVVIEPKTHIYGISLSQSTVDMDLKEIVEQVKRHVDNVHSVYIDYDKEDVCSDCGREWELDEETGEPTCCDSAIAEHNEELAKKSIKELNKESQK